MIYSYTTLRNLEKLAKKYLLKKRIDDIKKWNLLGHSEILFENK